MDVETVSTADHSLLNGVRDTLAAADDALLCVAFVHSRGVHLIKKVLKVIDARRGSTRLLVTTTFDQTNGTGLAVAASLGAVVKTLNPGAGSTYHPKVYLARSGKKLQALVGSANLTGGLATNVEVGVLMRGTTADKPLAELSEWAEGVWQDRRATPWLAYAADAAGDDELAPDLLQLIDDEVHKDPVFMTLGRGATNRVTTLTRSEVFVETERTQEAGRPASIPAWMFNLAWDALRSRGTLTNTELLNHLRVHRSSAVCAILARLPGVEPLPGQVGVRLTRAPR